MGVPSWKNGRQATRMDHLSIVLPLLANDDAGAYCEPLRTMSELASDQQRDRANLA